MKVIKEGDNDSIFGMSGSGESDLSDEHDRTYVVPALETCFSHNEAMIRPLHSTDYKSESEEENIPRNTSPSAPVRNL